jgi:hypothetical protein
LTLNNLELHALDLIMEESIKRHLEDNVAETLDRSREDAAEM